MQKTPPQEHVSKVKPEPLRDDSQAAALKNAPSFFLKPETGNEARNILLKRILALFFLLLAAVRPWKADLSGVKPAARAPLGHVRQQAVSRWRGESPINKSDTSQRGTRLREHLWKDCIIVTFQSPSVSQSVANVFLTLVEAHGK